MQSISLYDILSKVIPGSLFFFLAGVYHWTLHEKIPDVLALFLIYLIGYLIDSCSTIFERVFLFRLFGGTPSTLILEGKSFTNIGIDDFFKVDEYIKTKFADSYVNKQVCFRKMYSIVNKTDVPRVKAFLDAYVFSRNILVSYIIAIAFFLFNYYSYLNLTVAVFIAVLIWYNSKVRAWYFAKEVVDCFIRDNV